MKKSRQEAAETRRRIVATAATEFRRNGIDGSGLSDIMSAAGLTKGGFYKHFDSKEHLVAEACATGMATVVDSAKLAAEGLSGAESIKAVVADYLSASHRNNRATGCLLSALGSELARCNFDTRDAMTAEFVEFVETFAKGYDQMCCEDAKNQALVALSAMVGAMTMARMVTDSELSDAILEQTKRHLLKAEVDV